MKAFFILAAIFLGLHVHAAEPSGSEVVRCAYPAGLSSPTEVQLFYATIEDGDIGKLNYMSFDGQRVYFVPQLNGEISKIDTKKDQSHTRFTYLIPLRFDIPKEKKNYAEYLDQTYLCVVWKKNN